MEKKVTRLYWILAGILAVVLLVVGYGFQNQVFHARKDPNYRILAAEQSLVENHMEYTLKVPDIQNGRQELVFYTTHQNVTVTIDGKKIYEMAVSEDNAFGRTPGRAWNYVPLTQADEEKELKIFISSPYEKKLYIEPILYFGEKSEIVLSNMLEDLLPLCLAVVTLLVGVLLIGFVVYTSKDSRVDKSLAHLGVFAIMIALWQIFDLPISSVLFPDSLITCYMPLVALMFIPIPFVLFVRQMHKSKGHVLWSVMCGISFANIIINTFLQLTKIADFRDTLWITHVTFGVVMAMGIFMLAREWKSVGLSPKLKLNLVCVSACAAGTLLDMIVYYTTSGSTTMICGLTGFLVYVVIFGSASVTEAKHLMAIGKEAEKFEKMAFHDQLTGLYNRLAWVDMIKKIGDRPEEYIVIMMDLNDLKKCNDTLGHDSGDCYIRTSAKIMEKAFGSYGTCFRMGGDEFCVLFHSRNIETYMDCMDHLLEEIKKYNTEKHSFPIQIAYGEASFDKLVDYDLNDTKSRADAAMYHRKFKMKNGEE